MEFAPVPPAHTDGDAYLFFPDVNILHTGDLLFNGTYPLIDYSTGGWIGGMVSPRRIACSRPATPNAHHPWPRTDGDEGRSEGQPRHAGRQSTTASRNSAKEGKTAKEVVAAAPTKDFDDRFGKGMKPDQFVEIAYTGVLRHG